MIKGKELQPIVARIFGDVKGYLETEQIQVNCPICQEREGLSEPDGRFNLEINTALRVFRCWKCDNPKFSGGLKRLVRRYGTNVDLQMYVDYAGDEYYYDPDKSDEPTYVELPEEFISFKKMNEFDVLHMEAYRYMIIERQISKETLFKYNIGFCVEGKYEGRIVIPSYNANGELNYFITRAFRRGLKPPYLNPPQ